VPEEGIEPSHLAVHDFESCASTNSATPANMLFVCRNMIYFLCIYGKKFLILIENFPRPSSASAVASTRGASGFCPCDECVKRQAASCGGRGELGGGNRRFPTPVGMARIIAVVNQKGGVGKTTSAVNLGWALTHLGQYVLLVDLDPQANATSYLGMNPRTIDGGIYEGLFDAPRIGERIRETSKDGYRIIPATLALAGAHVELVPMERREYKLYDALQYVRHNYDTIIIDCPPALGLLTINALVGADEILIPVQAEHFALEGLGQLMDTINLVRKHVKPELNILGAMLTMYEDRYKLSKDIFEELYKYFPEKIFRSVIPRSVKLAESPRVQKTIFEHDPKSKAARAYERLAKEIINV
jgi:chromosome partitioning protein